MPSKAQSARSTNESTELWRAVPVKSDLVGEGPTGAYVVLGRGFLCDLRYQARSASIAARQMTITHPLGISRASIPEGENGSQRESATRERAADQSDRRSQNTKPPLPMTSPRVQAIGLAKIGPA